MGKTENDDWRELWAELKARQPIEELTRDDEGDAQLAARRERARALLTE